MGVSVVAGVATDSVSRRYHRNLTAHERKSLRELIKRLVIGQECIDAADRELLRKLLAERDVKAV